MELLLGTTFRKNSIMEDKYGWMNEVYPSHYSSSFAGVYLVVSSIVSLSTSSLDSIISTLTGLSSGTSRAFPLIKAAEDDLG